MSTIKAFPNSNKYPDGEPDFNGMDLRDYFAIRAPEPDDEYIKRQQIRDKNLNPHNEPRKPPIRSALRIICDYKYQYADAMMEARK